MKLKKIIVMLVIVIILFSKDSLGKYLKEYYLKSDNELSKAVISIENDDIINIKSIENRTFGFKIKNYNNEEISKIDIEYYFKIFVNNNFLIKIYKNDKEIIQNNNQIEKSLLSKNIKQEDVFKIEIIFLDNSDQEIDDTIKMKIYYEQINT